MRRCIKMCVRVCMREIDWREMANSRHISCESFVGTRTLGLNGIWMRKFC